MKVTKKNIEMFLKTQLSTKENWAIKALLRIYESQTIEEIEIKETTNQNGVGFNQNDAQILTGFAEQYKEKEFLSPKQKQLLMKRIPKYWKQILEVSDKKKLLEQMEKTKLKTDLF